MSHDFRIIGDQVVCYCGGPHRQGDYERWEAAQEEDEYPPVEYYEEWMAERGRPAVIIERETPFGTTATAYWTTDE